MGEGNGTVFHLNVGQSQLHTLTIRELVLGLPEKEQNGSMPQRPYCTLNHELNEHENRIFFICHHSSYPGFQTLKEWAANQSPSMISLGPVQTLNMAPDSQYINCYENMENWVVCSGSY